MSFLRKSLRYHQDVDQVSFRRTLHRYPSVGLCYDIFKIMYGYLSMEFSSGILRGSEGLSGHRSGICPSTNPLVTHVRWAKPWYPCTVWLAHRQGRGCPWRLLPILEELRCSYERSHICHTGVIGHSGVTPIWLINPKNCTSHRGCRRRHLGWKFD